MKMRPFVIILTVLLVNSSPGAEPFRDKIRIDKDLEYYGLAADSVIFGKNPVMNGLSVVENSILNEGGTLLNFYDLEYNGNFTCAVSRADDYFQGVSDIKKCNTKVRFPYTIKHHGKFLTFGWRYRGENVEPSNIYLWSSLNGIEWTAENGGLPDLSK